MILPPEKPSDADLQAFRVHLASLVAGAPLGTALPTRAAAWHYLVGRCGLEENAAKKYLPKVKTRDATTRRDPQPEEKRDLWLALMGEPPAIPLTAARRAILLIAETGLRLSEALNLTWEKVEEIETAGAFKLSVRGKGDKLRDVIAVGTGAEMLRELRPTGAAGLVFSGRDGPLHPNALRVELRRMGNRFPRLKGLHPHLLRHWYAFGSLEAGVDLLSLQAALGHESPETTAIYARPSLSKRIEAARMAQAVLWRPT